MTVDFVPTVTDQYCISFRPPGEDAGVEPFYMFERGYWALLDFSLSYEPQGYSMTGIAYSAANAAFQACNRAVDKYCGLPRIITVSLRDLAYDDRFVMADEKLTLGGNIRLKSSTLGLDQEARVMRLVHDIVDPMATRVILDTEPLLLTEAV